jgi:hypothetical protein
VAGEAPCTTKPRSSVSALRKIRATLTEQTLKYLDHFPLLFHTTAHGFGDYRTKTDIIRENSVCASRSQDLKLAPTPGQSMVVRCRSNTGGSTVNTDRRLL